MYGPALKVGFHPAEASGLSRLAVNKVLKARAHGQRPSALRARKSGISGLPKMALGAISTPIRAAIDKIRAVRAGRREV